MSEVVSKFGISKVGFGCAVSLQGCVQELHVLELNNFLVKG